MADYPITPVVPHEDPDSTVGGTNVQAAPTGYQITTEPRPNPIDTSWWNDEIITDIPKDSVGWLVSQGWVIDSITWIATTNPPTPRYTLRRRTIDNEAILISLLGEYTFAYNAAMQANNVRFNNVVVDWDDMIGSSQTQFAEQVAAQNSHAETYLADLSGPTGALTKIREVIDGNEDKLITDVGESTTALTALDDALADFAENYGANLTKVEALLGTHGSGLDQATFLSDFITDFVSKLEELATNYVDGATGHLADVTTLLGEADADVLTHEGTSGTHAGTTLSAHGSFETALNAVLVTAGEAADKHLGIVAVDIGDVLTAIADDYTALEEALTHPTTGLIALGESLFASHKTDYNTVLGTLQTDHEGNVTDATAFLTDLGATELARINEKFAASLSTQLQQLVDQGLYSSAVAADITARNTRDKNEEIVALNDRLNREKFENQHRLYEQQVTMRQGTMAGKDHVHGLEQELLRYEAQQLLGLHGLEQTVRDRTMSGKQALYAIRDAFDRFTVDVKTKLYTEGQAMRRTLLEEAARLDTIQQNVIGWKTAQRVLLYNQKQTIVTQNLEGLAQEHSAQQSVFGAAIAERDTLLGQAQETVRGVVAGKAQYAGLTSQNASILVGQRHSMIAEQMNETFARRDGGQKKHDEDMALMAYQLKERNELLIGLFGFVERRDDVGPDIKDLSTVVTSLGDAGGGWLTP